MTTFSTVLLRFDGEISIASGSTPVRIKGSNGADTVTVARGVDVVLDGSFNRGNDVINFVGLASSYSVTRLNSSSIKITDAQGTSVTIPVGTTGATIQFADATRELKGSSSGITLGTQTVSATETAVAAGSGTPAPFAPNADAGAVPGFDPNAFNVVVLGQGANIVLGEDSAPTRIRGSNGTDTVTIADGTTVILDGSFNRGNDTIIFTGNAADYSIQRVGSSTVKITDAQGTSVTIPVGSAGTTIQFADAARELVGSASGITLNDQVVTNVASPIAPGLALGKVFTLTEVVVEGTPGTPGSSPVTKQVVYWGYNPHGHGESGGVDNTAGGNTNNNTNEGPEDGGIPLADLVDFLTTITGLDLTELGLIDDDGTGPFDNVTNLSISNATTLSGSLDLGSDNDGNTADAPVLVIEYDDGRIAEFNIEAQIGEMYFAWLNSLLFDAEGNSRLFVKDVVVSPGSPGSSGSADTLEPIVLTTTENNGGTIETGVTTRGDDLIVAGRLELLHQAYIDGGAGENTLQINAKGIYAQPLQVLNVQTVKIVDLPNFYTTDYGTGEGYLENTVFNGNELPSPTGSGSNDSWIDLTNVQHIEKLVITDQGSEFANFDNNNGNGSTDSGNLFVVGVRNGATLRLEGAFVSGTTTVQYGPGINADGDGKFNLELAIGATDDGDDIYIVQNLDVMEIKSEGVANNLDTFFAGGNLSQLFITGTGHFSVQSDLDDSFDLTTPVVIDAGANTGGVDLTLSGAQNVTVVGSQANDRFVIQTADRDTLDGNPTNDETVTIDGGAGNNYYQVAGAELVTITNGDGNNNYEVNNNSGQGGFSLLAVGVVTITTGNGDNHFELQDVANVRLKAGNGDNRFDISSRNGGDYTDPDDSPDYLSVVTIEAGNGQNLINVEADVDVGTVDIRLGSGGNEVNAYGHAITIEAAGTAANHINAYGDVVAVNVASSIGSHITVGGFDEDYARSDELGGNLPDESSSSQGDNGALLTIVAGRNATVVLGADEDYADDADTNFPFGGGNATVTAMEGSSISGTNVTLVVKTEADLRAANLSGITRVVLDDDSFDLRDAPLANEAEAGFNASVLTLTASQFLAIGAANFAVEGAIFNTHAFIKIIVDQSTSLTALGVNNLPRNIDLLLEVQDGVTLTMTAEQLHTRVAQEGVTLANDGNTDLANGKVVINGGGLNFDPFNTTDQVSSVINGTTYFGGSLSEDFMVNGSWYNVTVRSVINGYDRPADAEVEVVLTIDSAFGTTVDAFSTWHTNLEIVGDENIVFTGPIELGEFQGNPTNPFNIDFSALEGEVQNFVVDNFEVLGQEGGSIVGNAANGYNAEVLISLAADEGVQGTAAAAAANNTIGFDEADAQGLRSSGVTKYTVVTIDGPTAAGSLGNQATLKLCDATEDLEVLALRGNYNDTLNVVDAAWGLVFELQGGSTAKADGPSGTANVGRLVANFEWPGAAAVVNLVHSVAGDTRPIQAYGIDIDNAASLAINALEGSATIKSLVLDSVTQTVDFASTGSITVSEPVSVASLGTLDAADVSGNFTATITGDAKAGGFDFVAADGSTTLTLEGFDASAGSSFTADPAANFTLVVKSTGGNGSNLSSAALSGVDKIVLGAAGTAGEVTLSIAQVLAVGPANIVDDGNPATAAVVNVTGYAGQALASFGAGVALGSVTTASGTVVLDPSVVLSGADLVIPAGASVTMTADQALALDSITGGAGSKINITGVTQAHIDAGLAPAVSGVTGTVTFAESVNLTDSIGAEALHLFQLILASGQTLGVATQEQADGLKVSGPADSSVKMLFNSYVDPDGAGPIFGLDVSGYAVGEILVSDLLVNSVPSNNIDSLLRGLRDGVEKVIFNDYVEIYDQTVTLQPGAVMRNDILVADRVEDNIELANFTLNLLGGNVMQGLRFSNHLLEDPDLIKTYLQTVTINSSGTTPNPVSGDPTNIILGDIDAPNVISPFYPGDNQNDLLDVTINASQALEIRGTIVFNRVAEEDGIDRGDTDAVLTINGTADVTIAEIDTDDGDVDGLNVVNNGTGTLTVGVDGGNIDGSDALSFTGTGDIVLQIGGSVDLSDDNLSAVSAIQIEQGATVKLTLAQATAVGPENITLAPGATAGSLNLEGLGEDPFAVADFGPGISVDILSVVDQPTVTLHPDTDLTGIGGLLVPEGVVLNLTAEQFQQLTNGTIAVQNTDGNPANDAIVVNITNLTQATVLQGPGNHDVSGIDVGLGQLTVTLGENVAFTSTAQALFVAGNGELPVINIPDGMKLTIAEVTQLDGTGTYPAEGMTINGGAGSALELTDISGFLERVDASNIDVSFLRLPTLLVAGNNVDFMFTGLQESVTKVIYGGVGDVEGRSQVVTIEGGLTVPGDVSFNEYLLDVEVTEITINLMGGTLLAGDVVLSTVQVNGGGTIELVPTYLEEVVINSTGTTPNITNGNLANVITGNITPAAYAPAVGVGSRDNQLKSVTILADQALVIEGDIVFSSHGGAADNAPGDNNYLGNEPNDLITANNNEAAVASLVVTGSADVALGGIDTSDDDIDGANVVNNGTGTLSLTVAAASIDAADALSFTGTGDIELAIEGAVDLSNDVITAVSQITINDGAVLTISQVQYDALGGANIIDGENNAGATLIIDEFDGGPFNAGDIDPDIDVTLVTTNADVTLDGDFTGVSIQVLEGNTLTLTAAQYNQIALNGGTISVIDGPDAGTGVGSIDVVITGLTQADVDAGFDLDDLTVGTGGSVNITLGEASVDLGTFDSDGMLVSGSEADITTGDAVKASFTLTDGQTLGVVNLDQTGSQDGPTTTPLNGGRLVVDGTGTTTLVFKFIPPAPLFNDQIDASGYDVSFLRVLATMFGVPGDANVEYTLDDLASDVTLVLYENPTQLGFLDPTFRVVIIEEGVNTPNTLIFSDWDAGDEVRELDITMEGDALINGNLAIPTRTDKDPGLVQVFFEELTIRSEGPSANRINGDITTLTVLGAPNTSENNLLTVNIVADQDLIIGDDATAPFVFTTGTIRFNSVDIAANNATATLNVSGTGDVFMKGIDTTESVGGTPGDIATLEVNNTGTGTLTVTGGSDALELGTNTTALVFSGTGDIVLDTNTGADTDATDNNGIDGNNLALIDASGLSGDLNLGVIEDVSNAAFTFVAGTGVTKATLIDNDLDSVTPAPDTAGWLIDYTDAAPGSEFHLAWGGVATPPAAGSTLTINMGPNGTLFIDGPVGSTVDLSALVLDINTVQSIVLGDEVTLILTPAQADGLSIIAGPDSNANSLYGTVNLVGLTDTPASLADFDLSGIAEEVAGTITFAPGENDVTLAPTTDLGFFGISLQDLAGDSSSLQGQTIRFTTVDQADGREILVSPDGGMVGDSSTNVVWLFDSIAAPVDTADYSAALGRLWVTPALVAGEGGDVEQLFTTLPSTILRVEFSSLTELNVLLASQAVDRIVEFVHFTDLSGTPLTFSDVGGTPDEFLRSLELRLGGDVEIDDINISDVVTGAKVDPNSVYFNGLFIDSHRAVTRVSNSVGEILAAEAYRNDNDGTAEAVSGSKNENVAPDAPNKIGNITGDDTNANIDLLFVGIDTHLARTTDIDVGPQTLGLAANAGAIENDRGEEIVIGTITFDSSGKVNKLSSITDATTAVLDITGDNDVTIAAINTADTDIVNLTIDLSGFTAVLDPVLNVDNTEVITLLNLKNKSDDSAVAIFQEVEGNELSFFDASDYDAALQVTFSQIDSSNEDRDDPADGLDDPATVPGDNSDAAFTFTAGDGATTVALTKVGGNTPTLDKGSEWIFDFDQTSGTATGGKSQLIIDESVSFADGSFLTLVDASTYIQGDVDLSDVTLSLTNNGGVDDMRLYVGAGSSLTISVAQALALAVSDVEIVGEGSVRLVGDATDESGAALGAFLFTAEVDASAVTIVTAGPGADATGKFELELSGALALDGTTSIGQTVIGSKFDDALLIAGQDKALDYTFKGGAGDDFYDADGSGDFTYIVEAGTDTIAQLVGDGPNPGSDDANEENDVLVVSSGATAIAFVPTDFYATAATSNAGTVEIYEDADSSNNSDPFDPLTDLDPAGPLTVDLSLAQGPNGYNVTMQTDDIIIGSKFDDVLNGGNNVYTGTVDALTGGDGADDFVFLTQLSSAANLSQTAVAPVPNIDREMITLTADDFEDADEGLTINWTIDGVVGGVVVSLAGIATDIGAIRTAVISAINGAAGIQATAGVNPGEIIVVPTDTAVPRNLEITSITPAGTTGGPGFLGGTSGEPTGANPGDQAQVTTITVSGTPTPGDVYSLLLNLTGGGGDSATATADATPTAAEIAAGLVATLGPAGFTVGYTPGNDFFTVTDANPDNGGFLIALDTDAAFAGSGVSTTGLTGNPGDLLTSDVITDFDGGEGDRVVLGLPAGTFTSTAGTLADYAAAWGAATAALTGSAMYHFASVTDFDTGSSGPGTGLGPNDIQGGGLLFFDANLDGNIDGVLVLEGVTTFTGGYIA